MVEGRVDSSPAKPKKKYNYRVYTQCKHSPSCFDCPLEDCNAALYRVFYLNTFPEDIARNFHMGQLRKMRLYG